MHLHLPHPHGSAVRRVEPVRLRTVLAGMAALVALTAFVGVLAGAATWGFVRLLSVLLG